jgi:hypothetical protein
MNRSNRYTSKGISRIPLVSAACLALSGCYVVPLQADGRPFGSNTVVVTAPPPLTPAVANLRLYPTNDTAARIGVINGHALNLLDGRGQFSVAIAGETFTGEATRSPNKARSGIASGAGSRGSFINCEYSMSSSTQGVGTCNVSTGAEFRMHIGG